MSRIKESLSPVKFYSELVQDDCEFDHVGNYPDGLYNPEGDGGN